MRGLDAWSSGDLIQCYPMEEIAKKHNVSPGAVRTIFGELKNGRYPEYESYLPSLDDLRCFSKQLRASKRTLSQTIAGNILLDTLLKTGVDPSEWERLLKLLRRVLPEGFPLEAFSQAAMRLA